MPPASYNFSRVKVALLLPFWLYFGEFQIEIVGNTDVRTLLPLLLLLFRWSYGTYSNIESWQLSSFIFCFYSLPSSYYFYACTEYIFLHNMYSTMNTQSYIEKKKSIILTFDKKMRNEIEASSILVNSFSKSVCICKSRNFFFRKKKNDDEVLSRSLDN